MFSATKMVGIAAAVALLGVMVVAGPFTDQQSTTPAAPAPDPGEVSMYTGSWRAVDQVDLGEVEVFEWGASKQGEQWTVSLGMSDPRLSGISSCYSNVFATDRGAGWLRTFTCRTFNEEGTWHEVGRGYMAPKNGGIHYQSQLVGEGAYDGLFAVQRCDGSSAGLPLECEGAVFEGGMPETPAEAPDSPPETDSTS